MLVRVDLNVPMADGKVTDDTRIRAVAPTIHEIADKGGKASSSPISAGRRADPRRSSRCGRSSPAVGAVLGRPVAFAEDCIGAEGRGGGRGNEGRRRPAPREHPLPQGRGEERPGVRRRRSPKLGDLYVNDAFSAAHRAHASTEGLAHHLPAYAGRAMQAEIEALEAALGKPEAAGGRRRSAAPRCRPRSTSSRTSSARSMRWSSAAAWPTRSCSPRASTSASRWPSPTSSTPPAGSSPPPTRRAATIVLPIDAVVATEFKAGAAAADGRRRRGAGRPDDPRRRPEIDRRGQPLDRQGGDAGLERPARRLRDAALRQGARSPSPATPPSAPRPASCSRSPAAARRWRRSTHAGVGRRFQFVSTAGGAFLEWLEGKALPGVEVLRAA